MNLPNGIKPEVRGEAQHLFALGYRYTGQLKNGHLGFRHPQFGKTELPYSPSREFRDAHRSEVAKAMGISKRELELKLGIRQEKRQGPKVRRQRNEEGRRARTFASKPPSDLESVPRLPTPKQRFKELPDLIAKANHAVNISIPGSLDYQRALSEAASLRAEFMQLETEIAA